MIPLVQRKFSPRASKELLVDNISVVYTVKRVKNINVRIKHDGTGVCVSAPFWISESQVIEFIRSKSDWIQKQQEKTDRTLTFQAQQATPQQLEAYRAFVKEKTPSLVEKWEAIMGVEAGNVVYRNMTSRWGSCNPRTGRICINIQLARYPYECLEYVVVHELCHLLEPGHGSRFKQLMTEFLPDWKSRRQQLR